MDYSSRNRKDAANDPEAQERYSTLISNPQREQDETEKSSYGLDWLQNGIWYGPTKLDNKLLQNHENLESGIGSRG